MIQRIVIWTGLVGMLLVLSGCSAISSSEKQITYDDRFVINISEDFVSVPAQLVENKQLINKIVLAYKITNTQWFDKNLIISKSVIGPALDVNQFRTLQSKKLQRILVWYQPEKKQQISFTCNNEKINGLYVTFTLRDTTSSPAALYYLAQYQYLYWGTWYILSYISDTESDRDDIKDTLTKITCTAPVQGTWSTE